MSAQHTFRRTRNLAALLLAIAVPMLFSVPAADAATRDGIIANQQSATSERRHLKLAQRSGSSNTHRRCPKGTVGTYPKCRKVDSPSRKCRKGWVGKWPHCVKITRPNCPRGTVGRWPKCRKIEPPKRCPRGTTGRYPDCKRIVEPPKRCPHGTTGRYPDCKRIVEPPKRCPRGTTGRYPDCERIVTPPRRCPDGTTGKWPRCRRIVTPPPPRILPPRIIPPRTGQPSPPPVTLPDDRRPDEVVVMLDLTQGANVPLAIAQQYALVRLEGEPNTLLQAQMQRYRIPDGRTPAAVIAAMQGDARIALAQPNYLYQLQGGEAAPSVTAPSTAVPAMAAQQYATGQISLPAAHALAKGRQTLVAVIDSGVDSSHQELAGAVALTFNAVGDRLPLPDSHGTGVAGIIGARAQLMGVAPGTRLLTARAFFREQGKRPITTTFILLRAIDWSHKNKAQIFNLSFVGPADEAVRRILDAVHKRGAILIAAAGNGGPTAPAGYPAAYANVIAVTAVDRSRTLYSKASRGSYVAVAAPGVDILVPIPGNGYDFKSGTSFAAPHVTGMVALMLERNPALTSAQVRAVLASSARDLGPAGPDAQFGAGQADALGSVRAVIDQRAVEAGGQQVPTASPGPDGH